MITTRGSDVLDEPLGTLAGAPGPKASADRTFDGGGEMGELMRSIDWSKTALGPVSGWSQALKTMVGVVVRSPSSMHLVWGPELVQIYNDAYRPGLGTKHPILGQPAKESWADVWHLLGPKYAAGLKGQPATWSDDQPVLLDRKGFLEETYFRAAFIPVPDETAASGIGGVLSTVTETTEQVRKAALLFQAHADAERARTMMFAQLMQAPVPVCVLTGPEFVYSLANPLYLTMLNRKDVVGKTLRAVYPELAQDSPVFQLFEGVFSTGVAYTAEEFGAFIDKGNGPEDGYYKFTAQPVRDASGKVTEIIMVGIDVTPQVLARRRVESLVEELGQADQRKDEFLAMLGHELRNPLAPIRTVSALLDKQLGTRPEFQPLLGVLARQTTQLTRLVDDLLDIARLTHARVALKFESVECDDVIDQAIETVRTLAAEKSHQLRIHRPGEKLYVSGDRARLVQTVTNLLHNAIKYTDPHGTITLALSTTEQEIVLSVQDTGVGISAELLPQVFDLFVQSERSLDRSQGGLGIGLSVARHLVGMHHGTLQAHSAGLGQGSTFETRLPRIPAPNRVEEAVVTPGAPRRILIVDDNEDAADMLALLLTSEGHKVDVVYRATDAIDRVAQQHPDVVLLDIGMPHMDGYAVVRALRAHHGIALRVIALTGYGRPEDRERTRAAGFDAHLVKPVDVQTLRSLLTG